MTTPARSYWRRRSSNALFAAAILMLIAAINLTQLTSLLSMHQDRASAIAKAFDEAHFSNDYAIINMTKRWSPIGQGIAKNEGNRTRRYENGTVEQISMKIENNIYLETVHNSDRELVLPNILLIGVGKAGTTTVSDWLFMNGVCGADMPEDKSKKFTKELHFFDLGYENGIESYAKRFQHCLRDGKNDFILDATPSYLPYAQRVYNTYTDKKVPVDLAARLKLILILREPISRELSWYNHKAYMVRHGKEVEWIKDVSYENGTIKSFDEYSDELKNIILREPQKRHVLYVDHLRNWIEFFDRRQLLILSYEELVQDPSKVQWRIANFLEAEFTGVLGQANVKNDPAKVKEIHKHAWQVLDPLFREKNEELYEFIRDHPGPPMEQNPFPRFESVRVQSNYSSHLFQMQRKVGTSVPIIY